MRLRRHPWRGFWDPGFLECRVWRDKGPCVLQARRWNKRLSKTSELVDMSCNMSAQLGNMWHVYLLYGCERLKEIQHLCLSLQLPFCTQRYSVAINRQVKARQLRRWIQLAALTDPHCHPDVDTKYGAMLLFAQCSHLMNLPTIGIEWGVRPKSEHWDTC